MTDKRVALAAVAGAHGVQGEVRLKLFSGSVAGLAQHAKVFVGGVEHRLLGVRDGGKTAIARFEGIADRSAVAAFWQIQRTVDNQPGLRGATRPQ